MDSYQEDRFGTLLKVDLFFSRNATALALNPKFGEMDAALDIIRADIFANDVLARRDLTGFSEAKANKRTALEDRLFLVCNGLRGHFAGLDDAPNLRMVDIERSTMYTISEDKLNTDSEIVWKIADPIKALLAPNQVTPAQVDGLQTLRQEFVAMMKVQRAEQGSSKAAREKIVPLFEKAFNVSLPKLDELMMPFASGNPGLYSEYKTARMIDNSGGGSGSDDFDLENYTIPTGGWIVLGNMPDGDIDVYIRNLSDESVTICSGNGSGMCASGYVLAANTLYKGPFSGLGLDPAMPLVQISNASPESVIVRAGFKVED